jgi:hypothetical protein
MNTSDQLARISLVRGGVAGVCELCNAEARPRKNGYAVLLCTVACAYLRWRAAPQPGPSLSPAPFGCDKPRSPGTLRSIDGIPSQNDRCVAMESHRYAPPEALHCAPFSASVKWSSPPRSRGCFRERDPTEYLDSVAPSPSACLVRLR